MAIPVLFVCAVVGFKVPIGNRFGKADRDILHWCSIAIKDLCIQCDCGIGLCNKVGRKATE